jgi:putative radical SAM enzyme (TIGR03279 family)
VTPQEEKIRAITAIGSKRMRKIITDVAKGSPLYKKGVRAGDEAAALNGRSDFDMIDYLLATAEDAYTLEIMDHKKRLKTICVSDTSGRPPGASFEHMTIDAPKRCLNNCAFCFMDQLPGGMRATLHFKDDDYRLSFISGNYVTLTNVGSEALERIARLKLSPMNVSVHTTNPALRVRLMKNPNAGNIMAQLEYLAAHGIALNLQLVLCPGLNDGGELVRTMEDILTLGGAVNSLSCVPVG